MVFLTVVSVDYNGDLIAAQLYFTIHISVFYFMNATGLFWTTWVMRFVMKAWRSQCWHWNDRRNGGNKRGCRLWVCLLCLQHSVVSVLFCTWRALFHVRTPNLQRECQIFLIRCKNAFRFRGASPPDPWPGHCPWTPLGALPQTPM